MAVVFNLVIAFLAGLSILLALYFAWKAVSSRSKVSSQSYNVGRLEARRSARVNLIRSVFALALGLVLLGVLSLGPVPVESIPIATPTPAPRLDPTKPPATATPELEPTAVLPTPTSPLPTKTPTPLPTPTNTPEPPTATVSSGVGVWLRDAPGTETEQLEWLQDGTVVLLLSGRETADDFEWQQVQTDEGLVGWVALDFIIINEP